MQRSFLVFVVEFITNISPTSQHHQAWKRYLHRSCRSLVFFCNNCEVFQLQLRDISPCLSQLGLLGTSKCVASTIITILGLHGTGSKQTKNEGFTKKNGSLTKSMKYWLFLTGITYFMVYEIILTSLGRKFHPPPIYTPKESFFHC